MGVLDIEIALPDTGDNFPTSHFFEVYRSLDQKSSFFKENHITFFELMQGSTVANIVKDTIIQPSEEPVVSLVVAFKEPSEVEEGSLIALELECRVPLHNIVDDDWDILVAWLTFSNLVQFAI